MTDLAEKIRERLDAAPDTADGILGMQAALSAVLELHVPVSLAPSSEFWSRESASACVECSPGEDDHYDVHWPCPIVRAIAAKLGIEVDRG